MWWCVNKANIKTVNCWSNIVYFLCHPPFYWITSKECIIDKWFLVEGFCIEFYTLFFILTFLKVHSTRLQTDEFNLYDQKQWAGCLLYNSQTSFTFPHCAVCLSVSSLPPQSCRQLLGVSFLSFAWTSASGGGGEGGRGRGCGFDAAMLFKLPTDKIGCREIRTPCLPIRGIWAHRQTQHGGGRWWCGGTLFCSLSTPPPPHPK